MLPLTLDWSKVHKAQSGPQVLVPHCPWIGRRGTSFSPSNSLLPSLFPLLSGVCTSGPGLAVGAPLFLLFFSYSLPFWILLGPGLADEFPFFPPSLLLLLYPVLTVLLYLRYDNTP